VTDPDLIEKSNLNRQFLFRQHDIRQAKSTTAARAAQGMNGEMRVEAMLERVGPETEGKFSDEFIEGLDVAVNALDNVAARLYMDGRCVTAQRPLLESGTLGSKGHVQVIVPHLTETYSSQRDPPEKDVAFCTIHVFPNHAEHTIQWAKDRFAKVFSNKPAEAQRALRDKGEEEGDGDSGGYVERARAAGMVQYKTVRSVAKMLARRPRSYEDCVAFALMRFRSYFGAHIAELLAAMPLDAQDSEGKSFWAPPRRPPTPIDRFDASDALHLGFVRSAAAVWASVHGIEVPSSAVNDISLAKTIAGIKLAPRQMKATQKKVIAQAKTKNGDGDDDGGEGEEEMTGEVTPEKFEEALQELARQISECRRAGVELHAAEFEKDEDTNGHVEFVWAAAGLRAANYGIQRAERLEVKRIAGHIIPAIATTTAAVSGLVACELVKVVNHAPAAAYRNAFVNLAIGLIAFSEPAPPVKERLAEGVYFTVWDRWEFRQPAGTDVTLQQFMDHFRCRLGLTVTAVLHGQRMVFADMIPSHTSRLGQKLVALLGKFWAVADDGGGSDGGGDVRPKFVELVVTFADAAGNDVNTPPIKFFF
jgi:ubiquitin-activating enzyme E1-like protein 2